MNLAKLYLSKHEQIHTRDVQIAVFTRNEQ